MANQKKKFPEKKVDISFHQGLIETPSGKGMEGDVDKIVKDLKIDNMAEAFGVMFAGVNSIKSWDQIKSTFNKTYLSTINTATNAILTEVQEIKKLLSTDELGIKLERLTTLFDAYSLQVLEWLIDNDKSDMPINSITFALSDKTAKGFIEVAGALKAVDESMIESLIKMVQIIGALEKFDLAGINKNIVQPLNGFTEIKVKDVKESLKSLIDAINGDPSLETVLTSLSSDMFKNVVLDDLVEATKALYDISANLNDLNGALDSPENVEETLTNLNSIAKVLKGTLDKYQKLGSANLEDTNIVLKNLVTMVADLNIVTKAIVDGFDVSDIQNSIVEITKLFTDKDQSISALMKSINEMDFPENDVSKKVEPLNNLLDGFTKLFGSFDFQTVKNGISEISEIFDELIKLIDNLPNIDKNNNLGTKATEIANMFDTYDKQMNLAVVSMKKGNAAASLIASSTTQISADITAASSAAKKASTKTTITTFQGLGAVVLGMGAMMIVGSLITAKHPNFIRDAYRFGAALTVFVVMIVTPLLLINKLITPKTEVSINGLGKMIFAMGMTMVIGSMFYTFIPNFSKYVKQFVLDFTLFMFGMMIPIKLISTALAYEKGARSMAKLITRCAIIMIIGAFFVQAQGGNLVKASLMFGVVLGLFMLSVMTPLIILGALTRGADVSVKGFAGLLITCTIVMLIGASIVNNTTLIKNALKFGLVLGLFLLSVLLPIRLVSTSLAKNMVSIKKIGGLVLECAFVLMVGGWFMTNKRLAKGAIDFAILTAAFIAAIVLTVGFGAKAMDNAAVAFVHEFNKALLIITVGLMVGGVFMTNKELAKGAVDFALLVAGFTFVMVLAFVFASKMFNKKAMQAISNFVDTILILSIILLIGTFFINKFGFTNALLFAVGVGAFIVIIAGALWVMNKMFQKMKNIYALSMEFALVVTVLSVVMLLGALFISHIGFENALLFSVAIAAFLVIISGAMALMSLFEEQIMTGAILANLIAEAMAVLGIAMFIVGFSVRNLKWEHLAIFVAAVAAMALVFGIIGIWPIAMAVGIGSVVATMMGVALGSLAVAFMLVSLLAKMNIKEGAQKLNEGIMEVMMTFSLLGVLSPLILPGSIVGTLLAVAVGSLAIAFTMLAALCSIKINGKEITLKEGAKELSDGILAVVLAFSLLGLLSVPIALGSVVGVAMSAAIVTLSLAFTMLAALCAIKINGKEISLKDAANELAGGIYALLVPFTVLGLPTTILIFGLASASAAMLTGSLTLLSIAFLLLSLTVNDKTVEKVGIFRTALLGSDEEPGLIGIMKSIAGPKTLVQVKLGQRIAIAVGSSIRSVSKALSAMHEALSSGNILSEVGMFNTILTNLMQTFDSSKKDSPYHDVEWGHIIWTVSMVKSAIHPMVRISSDLFKVVKDFATLMIPDQWDKEGKPIHYMQLKEQDFVGAANSITSTIEALLEGFAKIGQNQLIQDMLSDINESNGISGFFRSIFGGGKKGKSMLSGVVKVTGMISQVISQVGDNIVKFATLQVPDAWNKDGVAIHYRQLTPADFTAAAQGIVDMLDVSMQGIVKFGRDYKDVIEDFANNDSSGWFGLKKGKSKISKTLAVAGKIGDFVAGMAEGIKNYATLQIPDQWNKDGKPIHFRTLKEDDFIAVKANIQHIISGVTDAIRDANWVWPSKVENITEAVETVSKMLADVAKVIVDYSTLRIPVYRSGKKEPDSYRSLTTTDFKNFASNVKEILLAVPAAFIDGMQGIWNKGYVSADVKYWAENLLPMTELLANIVNTIKTYASLKKIPILDKDGKIASYIEIDLNNDLKEMGNNVANIISGMTTAISVGYWKFKTISGAKSATEMEQIIEAVKPIGDLLKSLIESVQAYAELKIPKYNKKGEINGYVTLIDDKENGFNTLFASMQTNISTILKGMIEAIASAIDGVDWLSDANKRIEMTQKFDAMKEIFDPLNNAIKFIKDYAELKIPTGYDSKGNPKGYIQIKDFKSEDFKTKIKEIMKAIPDAAKEGIIAAQPSINDLLHKPGFNFYTFTSDYIAISKFIADDIFPAFKSFVEFKIPIEFDKDGKPKKYFKLDTKTIANLETTISAIICSVPNAMHKSTEKINFTREDYNKISDMQKLIEDAKRLLNDIYNFDRILDFKNLNFDATNINTMFSALERNTFTTNIILNKLFNNICSMFDMVDQKFVHGKFTANARERLIMETMRVFTNLKAMLNAINAFGEDNDTTGLFGFRHRPSGFERYKKKVKEFSDLTFDLYIGMHHLAKMNDEMAGLDPENSNNAFWFIHDINFAIDMIDEESVKTFAEETESLVQYVKSINSIDIRRVSEFTRMINTLNQLFTRLGSLDRFTDELANKLSEQLAQLTEQMKEAAKVINNADTLRDKRRVEMNDTLDRISNIMNQTLQVNVSSGNADVTTSAYETPKR